MESKVQLALGVAARPAPVSAVTLPDFTERPHEDFPWQSTWLLIGQPKNGKSKLAEHLSRAALEKFGKPLLHLDTENGAHQIHGAKIHVLNLGELDRLIQALEVGGHEKYSGFILDTTDMLSEWCDRLTCLELKIGGIGQAEYGKDYVVSRNHFMSRMMRLKTLGKALILIAHTKTEKRDDVSQTRPNLTGQLSEMVMGQSDSIAYLALEKVKGSKPKRGSDEDGVPDTYKRILSFAGHEGLCAGSRYEALNGQRFELQDLTKWPEGNLWLPVFDAFKIQEEAEQTDKEGKSGLL